MTAAKSSPKAVPVVPSAMDAIYSRRAIRDYTTAPVEPETVRALIDAAIQAPTAMHVEPWSFVVIQNKSTLDRLSETAKELVIAKYKGLDSLQARHMVEIVETPNFNTFYNAHTLIAICSKASEAMNLADCWLAAENLMLAATAKGLGTCVIGFAIEALNTPEWKAELEIPHGTTVVAPILVGVSKGKAPLSARKPPEILSWKLR